MSEVLPLFPLTGSLLLPGNFLPLNVFEQRYRNLVRDVMATSRVIGMIQPRRPAPDNWGLAGPEGDRPALYEVGCAGRIEECEPQPDGRYLIVLRGERRFRILREIEPRNGYRRVAADLDSFAGDAGEPESGLDPVRLIAAVERFGAAHDLRFDRQLLLSLPAVALVHALSAALPFAAAEKQALLEAPTALERQQLLVDLIRLGSTEPPVSGFEPPTVH